jgi:hypothetical protein
VGESALHLTTHFHPYGTVRMCERSGLTATVSHPAAGLYRKMANAILQDHVHGFHNQPETTGMTLKLLGTVRSEVFTAVTVKNGVF